MARKKYRHQRDDIAVLQSDEPGQEQEQERERDYPAAIIGLAALDPAPLGTVSYSDDEGNVIVDVDTSGALAPPAFDPIPEFTDTPASGVNHAVGAAPSDESEAAAAAPPSDASEAAAPPSDDIASVAVEFTSDTSDTAASTTAASTTAASATASVDDPPSMWVRIRAWFSRCRVSCVSCCGPRRRRKTSVQLKDTPAPPSSTAELATEP
jgi:hypothetical protein